MKYSELIKYGCDTLKAADIFEWSNDAWQIIMFITGYSKARLFMINNDEADANTEEKYMELIDLRKKHIPLQYITNVQNFMGIDFYVDERVLIPRFDTEILVDWIIRSEADKNYSKVLDVCCGSGCIGIALKNSGLFQSVTGCDISDKALEVSRINAEKTGISVDFVESNLFSNINDKYDIIVSNPPYIESGVIEQLTIEVKEHEPRLALDGGTDGLDIYRKLIKEAREYLSKKGCLYLEIGYNQGQEVSDIMKNAGFDDIQVKKDLNGLDRCVRGYFL